MAEERKPIQIGFSSGQTVGLKLEPKELDALIAAIKAGEPWHTVVEDEHRRLTLRADHVDFYATDDRPEARRAGF